MKEWGHCRVSHTETVDGEFHTHGTIQAPIHVPSRKQARGGVSQHFDESRVKKNLQKRAFSLVKSQMIRVNFGFSSMLAQLLGASVWPSFLGVPAFHGSDKSNLSVDRGRESHLKFAVRS